MTVTTSTITFRDCNTQHRANMQGFDIPAALPLLQIRYLTEEGTDRTRGTQQGDCTTRLTKRNSRPLSSAQARRSSP